MFDFIFSPQSIAIIGASDNPKKIGYALVKNLIDAGFRGRIYPINPKKKEILGLIVYPSIKDVPEVPDLVVIAIPAAGVCEVLEECGEKGVKGAIVISAGFREIGKEGALLEKKLLDIAKKYNIRLVGPNCLGVINTSLS